MTSVGGDATKILIGKTLLVVISLAMSATSEVACDRE